MLVKIAFSLKKFPLQLPFRFLYPLDRLNNQLESPAVDSMEEKQTVML